MNVTLNLKFMRINQMCYGIESTVTMNWLSLGYILCLGARGALTLSEMILATTLLAPNGHNANCQIGAC